MKISDLGILDYWVQDVLEKSILLPKKEFSELLDNLIDPGNRSVNTKMNIPEKKRALGLLSN
jgi:hypothetical protein